MNTEQLLTNLTHVRQETRSIMDNIRSVKGARHAELTSAFLQASTLVEIAALLARSSDLPDEVTMRIREVYLTCMSELIRSFLLAGRIQAKDIDEAIDEAKALEQNVQSMAKTAWSMAEDGRSYGGSA